MQSDYQSPLMNSMPRSYHSGRRPTSMSDPRRNMKAALERELIRSEETYS